MLKVEMFLQLFKVWKHLYLEISPVMIVDRDYSFFPKMYPQGEDYLPPTFEIFLHEKSSDDVDSFTVLAVCGVCSQGHADVICQ